MKAWTAVRTLMMPRPFVLLAAVVATAAPAAAATYSLNLVQSGPAVTTVPHQGHTSTQVALLDAATGSATLPAMTLQPNDVLDLSVNFTGDVALPPSFGISNGGPARWFWVSMGGTAGGPGGFARYVAEVSLFNDGVPVPINYEASFGVGNAFFPTIVSGPSAPLLFDRIEYHIVLDPASTLVFGAAHGPATFALLAIPELPTSVLLSVGAGLLLLGRRRVQAS